MDSRAARCRKRARVVNSASQARSGAPVGVASRNLSAHKPNPPRGFFMKQRLLLSAALTASIILQLAPQSAYAQRRRATPAAGEAQAAAGFDRARYQIAHKKFVLDNGLTLLVHEDHSVPVVAVNIWYHVGSRNEKRGKTGFAHLFEHFFFNGSENYPHGFREAMDDLGANNRNGTTNVDRTNFFEDVPVSALERTLYLDAASLEDVKAWYKGYYGPNNAVISLAGDITPERALELVRKYFGGIPPGPPLPRTARWVPRLERDIRDEMEDRVPQARIYRIYHAPAWKEAELEHLTLFAEVLSGSKSARLDRRLVYEKGLATDVGAFPFERELGSLMLVTVTIKPGVDPAEAEREMDAVINELIDKGPTAE